MTDVLPSESQPEASSSKRPLCAICTQHLTIYTCPRCALRTCSLPCSTAHKTRDACSGQRDKAKYVPMNQYGWGTMMDDYVFLEDVGRKIGEWGKTIAEGGFGRGTSVDRGRGGRGRGRGAGRGRGRNVNGPRRTKRDILKMELDAMDIDMDLLPAGMERRKANQSTWDAKNKTAMLTVEFKFHPPSPNLPQEPIPPYCLLTHRNSMAKPLLAIVQQHVTERSRSKKEPTFPFWIKALVLPEPEDPEGFTPPHFYMNALLDPLAAHKAAHYRLDGVQTLVSVLSDTHFVEYPTIDVWEEGTFEGTIIDTRGRVTRHAQEEERKPKRRKLNAKAGRKAISGLLGGYGSDEDGEEQEENNGLSLLGTYGASDDDVSDDAEGGEDGEQVFGTDDEDDDEGKDPQLDPAVLMELIKHSQTLEDAL
ncbi:hypothetical protein BJ138DRAFT_1139029 [Hygrophoropsis aurantiaca]|uniref:Uncharacterized protein n=1 Tax=Hygrophoropsis aurantiaca TaxID=72124 RepID=A0ACB8AWC6_9AGAM|nr:hypothetical protein BJ138DRAFT_1139029 [Hygrophoropsis aurantiaca]